jgi:hypothetical protein
MKSNIIEKQISYLGINDPKTKAQIEFEILGLECLMTEAKKKVAELRQAISLVDLVLEESQNDNNNRKSNIAQ